MPGRARSWTVRALVLILSGLATGAAVLAFSSRGDLEQARSRVDTAWEQLRPGLDDRYLSLGEAGIAARERLGDDQGLLADLAGGLEQWEAAGQRPVETQATLANRLEGYGSRLRAMVEGTPRLRSSDEVTGALAEMDESDPEAARAGYNQAVADYENVRGGFPRRLVAGALGFDSRRTVEFPT
ncbi:MAG: LemA family protein [Acidimicrobiia bacterium]